MVLIFWFYIVIIFCLILIGVGNVFGGGGYMFNDFCFRILLVGFGVYKDDLGFNCWIGLLEEYLLFFRVVEFFFLDFC